MKNPKPQKLMSQKWSLPVVIALVIAAVPILFGDNWIERYFGPKLPDATKLPEVKSEIPPIKITELLVSQGQENYNGNGNVYRPTDANSNTAPPITPQKDFSEANQTPLVELRPEISNISFLIGDWRLHDESCLYPRNFSIIGQVLEVHDVDKNLIYSGNIKRVDSQTLSMEDNSSFIANGDELRHANAQSPEVFFRCPAR